MSQGPNAGGKRAAPTIGERAREYTVNDPAVSKALVAASEVSDAAAFRQAASIAGQIFGQSGGGDAEVISVLQAGAFLGAQLGTDNVMRHYERLVNDFVLSRGTDVDVLSAAYQVQDPAVWAQVERLLSEFDPEAGDDATIEMAAELTGLVMRQDMDEVTFEDVLGVLQAGEVEFLGRHFGDGQKSPFASILEVVQPERTDAELMKRCRTWCSDASSVLKFQNDHYAVAT